MPSTKDHEAFAKQHFDEAEKMKQTQRLRWASVAYFYSAMHMVHAALPQLTWLTSLQQHPEAHTGPNGTSTIVLRHLNHLHPYYDSLFSSGWKVRYRGGNISVSEINNHRFTDLPPIGEWACENIHPAGCDCWMRAL